MLVSMTEVWGFTCDECPFNPEKDDSDDYVRVARKANPDWRYATRSFNLKYPERCKKCERNKKRYQRMRRRLTKIYDIAESLDNWKYRRPKLITFALPSIWTFESDGSEEISKLRKTLGKARELLTKNGVLGGCYVPEMTTRCVDDIGSVVYKHHAHIHMVAVAPFVSKQKLKEFCEILMPLGLGRINYVAPRGAGSKNKVASYISKYLTKDGRVCASFGILRKSKPVIEEIPPSDSGSDDCDS
jgi:hypothetical protein